jgi:hypothetical protein
VVELRNGDVVLGVVERLGTNWKDFGGGVEAAWIDRDGMIEAVGSVRFESDDWD